MHHQRHGAARSCLILALAAIGCAGNGEHPPGSPPPLALGPQKPRLETSIIPAGTEVVVMLYTPLSTETSREGDRFDARTADPVTVGGRTVVPAGTRVSGVLRDVRSSMIRSGQARMTLEFGQVEDSRGVAHVISARPLTLLAAVKTRSDVDGVGTGTLLGAIIGGASGAGGTAGGETIHIPATRGEDVELAVGQRLSMEFIASTSRVLASRDQALAE